MVKVRTNRAPTPQMLDKYGKVRWNLMEPRHHSPILVNLINRHPEWLHGAEIGVASGRTSLAILNNCPRIKMFAVDAFEYVGDSENSGLYEDMDHRTNETIVRQIEKRFDPRLTVLKGLTHEMARFVHDGSLDFVFIDASHMYADVKRDILSWAPKVKKDGWIMGHDYCERWDGVRRAVDELLGTPLELAQTIWAHERNAWLDKWASISA